MRCHPPRVSCMNARARTAGSGTETNTATDATASRRAARRARAKRWAWRSAIGAATLLVLAAVAVVWLVETVGGRDLLLRQIAGRLPADATFTWQSAEGPASGPLTLRGVRFTLPRQRDPSCVPTPTASCAMGTLVFTAQRITIDFALRPLLGRRLRLDTAEVEAATLDLPESDEPFEFPTWPEVLPAIDPPLSLRADDVRIDGLRVTSAGAPLIDIARARGGLDASSGRLHVERVVIDSDRGRITAHGDYAPADDYAMDFAATWVQPLRTGRTPARLGLVAQGDLSRMDIALAGRAPAPLRATLTLRAPAGEDSARWQLDATTQGFDPAVFAAAATPAAHPWIASLNATGTGGTADLRGRVRQGDFVAVVQPSRVRLADQVLDVQRLVVDTFGGRVTARGRADFALDQGREATRGTLRFAVNARGLRWGDAKAGPQVRADADLGIAGTTRAWAAIGTGRVQRGTQRATVAFDGRGDTARMAVRTLEARTAAGLLTARGDVRWAPALAWDLAATLDDFEAGVFAPGWDSAVDARATTRGATRGDGGLDIAIDAPRLAGTLRGQALSGSLDARIATAPTAQPQRPLAVEGEVSLRIGRSSLDARGRIADTLDIDARFAPFALGDLLPDARGMLDGTARITGARTAPDLDLDLSGRDVAIAGITARAFDARGRLPWRGGGGALTVQARGVQAGIALDTLDIDARGAVEDLALDARAQGPMGGIALSGTARKAGPRWSGTLARLDLSPQLGAPWALTRAASFAWDGRNGTLTPACLGATGSSGSLCASADWPRRGLDVDGNALPLSLVVPYLPAQAPGEGRQWILRGAVDLDAQLRPVGNAWRGSATVTSATGGLRFSPRARRETARYSNLRVVADFDPQGIDARLDTTLMDDGRLTARVATGWDAYAPLSGEVAMDLDELTWMELFSPDIVDPQGRLAGRITLGGTRGTPALGGQAQLTGFTTELPSLGLVLRDGSATLVALSDGSARIDGRVRSGEGTLAVTGTLDLGGTDEAPLLLNLRGSNVLVSDTRDLRAIASPDVQVRVAAGEPIRVTGRVDVPEADIDLERLDRGVSASPDVVVLDPVDPAQDAPSTLAMDLLLAVGDDVRMKGFGLDGQLGGQLRVRARPGREMLATGALTVDGEYSAYGQELQLEDGRLSWSNDPIANPVLRIRAQRTVGDIEAYVDVSGRATAPNVRVSTNTGAGQSEALSYLALGRPLSGLSGDERGELNAASAALSAGGSLLASQLGARLGLDASLGDSRTLGGSVLGIGRFLSPRLYVGVGVSLLGTGQVLTLKYLLRKGFDIELETSSVETRGSINYRRER